MPLCDLSFFVGKLFLEHENMNKKIISFFIINIANINNLFLQIRRLNFRNDSLKLNSEISFLLNSGFFAVFLAKENIKIYHIFDSYTFSIFHTP